MINKKKTIFIIGAGPSQLKGITAAKEMDFHVITVDGDANAPGFKYADKFYHIDIFEFAKIIDIALSEKVDFALTVSSEVCLETVAHVNKAINAKGLSLKQVKKVTNKGLMRDIFKEHNIPGPKHLVTFSSKTTDNICNELEFPLVVKPTDSSGSKGVALVTNPHQLQKQISKSLGFSKSKSVIVEEFMEGIEIALEGFVIDGKLTVLAFSDKIRTPPPYFLDTTVIFPSSQDNEVLRKAENIVAKAVKALDISDTPIHVELMITPTGVKIVEIAARGAGFCVYTDILPQITAVDPVNIQLSIANNEKIEINNNHPAKGACIKFLSAQKGTLKSINGFDEALAVAGVSEIKIYVDPGASVNDLTCGADRIGHIITYGETNTIAKRAADAAQDLITFEIDPTGEQALVS